MSQQHVHRTTSRGKHFTLFKKKTLFSANRQKEKENVAFQRAENHKSLNENNQKIQVQTMKIDKQIIKQIIMMKIKLSVLRRNTDRYLFY